MSEQIYKDLGVTLKSDALAALGAITVAWGQLGARIEHLILALTETEIAEESLRTQLILTSQLSLHPRQRVIDALIKHKKIVGTDLEVNLSAFTSKVRKLSKRRNNFIHASDWYTDEAVSPMVSYAISKRLGGKDGYLTKPHSFRMEEAELLLTDITACRDWAWLLVMEVRDHLWRAPSKPKPQ